jgi:hypothetical protein
VRGLEPGDRRHRLEQRAEQQQPDDRLDQGGGRERRLPPQGPGRAGGEEAGVPEQRGARDPRRGDGVDDERAHAATSKLRPT